MAGQGLSQHPCAPPRSPHPPSVCPHFDPCKSSRTHVSQPSWFGRVSALVMSGDKGWLVGTERGSGSVTYSPSEGVQSLLLNDQREGGSPAGGGGSWQTAVTRLLALCMTLSGGPWGRVCQCVEAEMEAQREKGLRALWCDYSQVPGAPSSCPWDC